MITEKNILRRLKKLERLSLSNASLEYRLQIRKLVAQQVNLNAVFKIMWSFPKHAIVYRLNRLVTAFVVRVLCFTP